MRQVVRWFDWDAGNREHIMRHGIAAREINELRLGEYVFRLLSRRPLRYKLIGRTFAGRCVAVVLKRLRFGVFRPVTAWDCSSAQGRLLERG